MACVLHNFSFLFSLGIQSMLITLATFGVHLPSSDKSIKIIFRDAKNVLECLLGGLPAYEVEIKISYHNIFIYYLYFREWGDFYESSLGSSFSTS